MKRIDAETGPSGDGLKARHDRRPQLFHTGITVARIEPAMSQLSASTGVTWRPIVCRRNLELRVESTLRTVDVRRVYTMEGPPYVELIDGGGDVWGPGGPCHGTHLGYWTRDLDADLTAFVNDGATVIVTDPHANAITSPGIVYLRTEAALLIELLPVERREDVLNR